MGIAAGPNVSRDGLVLYYDIANIKSFRGEPTTNLVSNPTMTPSNPLVGVSSSSTTTNDVGGSGWNWGYYENINIAADGGMEWLPGEIDPLGFKGVWKMKKRAGGNGESNWNPATAPGSIDQTKTYTFTVYCKTSVADTARIHLNVTKNGASDWSYASSYHVGNNKWQRLELIIPGGSGVSSINVVRCQSIGTSINTDILWKYYQIEQKNYPTAFVSGTRGAAFSTGGGLIDLSGSNNAEIVNGVTFSSLYSGAAHFDGVDDYLDMGTSVQLSNNFTICFWHQDANTGYILDQGNIGEDPTGSLELTNRGLTIGANNQSSVTADGTLNSAIPNFVCVSYASATTKFYINGNLDSTKTTAFSSFTPSGKLKIGRRAFNTTSIFTGKIFMSSIYNRVLTDTQIKDLYNATRVRFQDRQTIVTNGLVLHLDASNRDSYKGSGTTWTDLSGYGNNVTLLNGPVFKGVNGGAIQFDGVNDYAAPAISHSYLSSSCLEVIFISRSHGVGKKTIFGYRQNDGYSQPTIGGIYLEGNNIYASVITTTQVYRTATFPGSISTDVVYHVCLNKDTVNGTLQLFVNGVAGTAQTFDASTYAQWTTVGNFIGSNFLDIAKSNNTNAGQGYSNDYFNGSIFKLAVYSRILTSSEVLQNYNATKSRFGF